MNIRCFACGANYNSEEPESPKNQPFFELALVEPHKDAIAQIASKIRDQTRLRIVACPNCGELKVPIDDLPDSMRVQP